MSDKPKNIDLEKRDLLKGAAGVAGLAALAGGSFTAQADQHGVHGDGKGVSAAVNGEYETVALRQPHLHRGRG